MLFIKLQEYWSIVKNKNYKIQIHKKIGMTITPFLNFS